MVVEGAAEWMKDLEAARVEEERAKRAMCVKVWVAKSWAVWEPMRGPVPIMKREPEGVGGGDIVVGG